MLEPKELELRREHRVHQQNKRRHHRYWLPAVLGLVGVYAITVAVIPLAPLRAHTDSIVNPPKPSVGLPWPTYGQSAVGAVGFGLLAQKGNQKPLPTASVAKVITAVAVLKQRPIYEGKLPPIITITDKDVMVYKQFAAEGQSNVPVEAGEQLTEYQALQALLLPSANNIADTLVRWAFGSSKDYLEFVNPFTRTLGMKNTNMVDASGYLPQTVSTAADLTLLAEIAMNQPVIAEIVSQSQADLPVVGTVYNVNFLLGRNGVVGIKTGNTDEAGGCYLFSARRVIEGQTVTLVGAIMGAPDLRQALSDAVPIIETGFKAFAVTSPINTSQIVGRITQAGGKQTPIIVGKGLTQLTWGDQKATYDMQTNRLGSSIRQGDVVGTLNVGIGNTDYTVNLVAADTLPSPTLWWRIRHAAGYL